MEISSLIIKLKIDDIIENPDGCARAGIVRKIKSENKIRYTADPIREPLGDFFNNSNTSLSRENRAQNRRMISHAHRIFSDQSSINIKGNISNDLIRFNQLKNRGKHLQIRKSPIHEYGIFSMENIKTNEFVIDYVGEVIRMKVADIRQNHYEAMGGDSSYFFRIDNEYVVDATIKGNTARLINHCCEVIYFYFIFSLIVVQKS